MKVNALTRVIEGRREFAKITCVGIDHHELSEYDDHINVEINSVEGPSSYKPIRTNVINLRNGEHLVEFRSNFVGKFNLEVDINGVNTDHLIEFDILSS